MQKIPVFILLHQRHVVNDYRVRPVEDVSICLGELLAKGSECSLAFRPTDGVGTYELS